MCEAVERYAEKYAKEQSEKATKKATKDAINGVIMNMYKQGYTLDEIAGVTDISTEKVKSVIKKKSPAMA